MATTEDKGKGNPPTENGLKPIKPELTTKTFKSLTKEELKELDTVVVRGKISTTSTGRQVNEFVIGFHNKCTVKINEYSKYPISENKLKLFLLKNNISETAFKNDKNYIKCPIRLYIINKIFDDGRESKFIRYQILLSSDSLLTGIIDSDTMQLFMHYELDKKYRLIPSVENLSDDDVQFDF